MKITCGSIFLSKTVFMNIQLIRSTRVQSKRLIEFLGLFARRDAIRDNQFEFATDSDSEPSSSDNENE